MTANNIDGAFLQQTKKTDSSFPSQAFGPTDPLCLFVDSFSRTFVLSRIRIQSLLLLFASNIFQPVVQDQGWFNQELITKVIQQAL